jgi:dihydrofolate synthase/folylpolyglutamate synthase
MWVDEFLESLKPNYISLGLERIEALCSALDIPAPGPHVIVAGTNGKGSTCAYLESILRQAGHRIGFYSSPHLVDVAERIRAAGKPIPAGDLERHLRRIEAAFTALPLRPTFFEALTAAALLHFQEQKTALNILEVGLGGRYDATNRFGALLSLITPVSMDHQQALGRTLAAIAHEKAGILKQGVPAITGPQRPAVQVVLRREADAMGAPLLDLKALASWKVRSMEREGMGFTVRTKRREYALFTTLLGEHQAANAALAVAAAELLADRLSFPLIDEAIQVGVARAAWPGRLQALAVNGKAVLVDAAHNPGGAAVLARSLRALGARDLELYFCAMKDKRPLAVLKPLLPFAKRVHLLSIPKERSTTAAEWHRLRPRLDHPRVTVHDDLPAAFATAFNGGGTPLFTGSIYFLGEFYQWSKRLPSPAITPVTS